jgi:hypothetical protein
MKYLDRPLNIRGHHIDTFHGFLIYGGTFENYQNYLKGQVFPENTFPDITGKNAFSTYGERFVWYQSVLWQELVQNPSQKLVLGNTLDALCSACPVRKPKVPKTCLDREYDKKSILKWGFKIGGHYLVADILDAFLSGPALSDPSDKWEPIRIVLEKHQVLKAISGIRSLKIR